MRRTPRSLVVGTIPTIALVHVVVGAMAPPSAAPGALLSLARLVLALAASVSLVLGPGLALRAIGTARGRPLPWAFVGLPGPALLAASGALAWLGASWVDPHLTAATIATPVLVWLLVVARRPAPGSAAEPNDDRWARRAVLVALVVLVVAVAKGTWSPGPEGELYGGTVSRTLEVGARSDARIPFHVVQLVAHGTSPYSELGSSYFAPWSFSHRGPLAGLAAAPVVLLSGADVPISMPDQPWSPFDREGFATYRMAMSTMAVTSLLALFALVAHLLGPRVGFQATVLAALTPFVLHETYFTWPKLHAAGLVVVAAYLVLRRRPGWCGVVTGIAYLLHPMALFSLASLGLVWLLALRRGEPQVAWGRAAAGLVWMGAGVAVSLVVWRLANGDHFGQQVFAEYVMKADTIRATGPGEWLSARAASVANTLLPLHLVLRDGEHAALNSITGPSPGIVRFFLQYWTSLPFGLGVVALPVFVAWLARAARRWPAVFVVAVVVPFLLFAAFWGADTTGLLREGLHVWVLTLVAFVACARAVAESPRAAIYRLDGALFALRSPEALLMLVLPAWVTDGALYQRPFLWTDVIALVVMLAGLAWLGRETLSGLRPAPGEPLGEQTGPPDPRLSVN